MSRYLETMRTEMKYTTAKARNCACLLSSCGEQSESCYFLEDESFGTLSFSFFFKVRFNQKLLLLSFKCSKSGYYKGQESIKKRN